MQEGYNSASLVSLIEAPRILQASGATVKAEFSALWPALRTAFARLLSRIVWPKIGRQEGCIWVWNIHAVRILEFTKPDAEGNRR
jgi:hypothetical protein